MGDQSGQRQKLTDVEQDQLETTFLMFAGKSRSGKP